MNKLSKKRIVLNIGVITISDTRNDSNDDSGRILSERIVKSNHKLFEKIILRDDIDQIQNKISEWVESNKVHVIITTGGTGLTGRDKTPEAIEPLLDKRIDGFSALFHQVSANKIGTSTIQSRALAGIIKNVFIFSIPGSPGACIDAWDEIITHQLDINHKPCNLVEIIPRLTEV